MKIERYPDRNWDELAARLATEASNPEELIRGVLRACGWIYEVDADEWEMTIEWKTIGESERYCKTVRIAASLLHVRSYGGCLSISNHLWDMGCKDESRLYKMAYNIVISKIEDVGVLRSLGWI